MIKTLLCVLIIVVLTFDVFSNNALLGLNDKDTDKQQIIQMLEIVIVACLTMLFFVIYDHLHEKC
jgi:uncharacterized BrkB/YihY/UPF0761 family membrane protein